MKGLQVLMRKLERDTSTALSLLIVVSVVVAAAAAGLSSPDTRFGDLMRGARALLIVGGGAAALSTLVGFVAGVSAAWWGRRAEGAQTRLLEIVGTYPGIAMVAFVQGLNRSGSVLPLIAALTIVRVAEVTRVVRIEILRTRSSDFVLAAVSLGASPWRVAIRHIGPQMVGALAHSALCGFAMLVTLEAAMSFLGIGATSPNGSWGTAIAVQLRSPHPQGALVPALALFAVLWAFLRLSEAVARRPRAARLG